MNKYKSFKMHLLRIWKYRHDPTFLGFKLITNSMLGVRTCNPIVLSLGIFFFFLMAHPQHKEVPGPGIKSEPQL